MIALDTNILVHAHRRDADFHQSAAASVRMLAESGAAWAIPWPCVHEFLAIATHPRIWRKPSTLKAAVDQVDAWTESPGLVLLAETLDYWPRLRETITRSRSAGPKVHDARVAAICLAHGVREIWTADRDFSRFAGLTAVNPLATR